MQFWHTVYSVILSELVFHFRTLEMLNFLFSCVNSATRTGKGKHSCSPDWWKLCQIYVFSDLLTDFVLQFRATVVFWKSKKMKVYVKWILLGYENVHGRRETERAWIAWIMNHRVERAGLFILCSTQRPLEQMGNSRLCLISDEVVEFLWFVMDAGRFMKALHMWHI